MSKSSLTRDSDQEDLKKEVSKLLKRIDPTAQPYGKDFFESLARLIVNIGIETVFIRNNPKNAHYEILLRKRNEDETYAGQWHVPGSLLRYGEEIDDVFERILSEECQGIVISARQFVGIYNNTKEARGHALHVVYRCDVKYDSTPRKDTCAWFPLNALPHPMIEPHQEKVIPMVAATLEKNKK